MIDALPLTLFPIDLSNDLADIFKILSGIWAITPKRR